MIVSRSRWMRRRHVPFVSIPGTLEKNICTPQCSNSYIILQRQALLRNEINKIPASRIRYLSHDSNIAEPGSRSDLTDRSSSTTFRDMKPQPLPSNIQILFFSQVSIEPTYSAAGVRSLHLLNQFLRQNDTLGKSYCVTTAPTTTTAVHIISPPTSITTPPTASLQKEHIMHQQGLEQNPISEHIESNIQQGFHYHTLRPNRTDDAYQLLDQICNHSSDGSSTTRTNSDDPFYIMIYDRYYSEEMYSFQVYNYFHKHHLKTSHHSKHHNNYMSILDMQDMHSLRYTRQFWVQQKDKNRKHKLLAISKNDSNGETSIDDDVLRDTIPTDDILPSIIDREHSDRLLRELASIYRCDITFVCSMSEYNVLVHYYHIPANKLCYAPLFGSTTTNGSEMTHDKQHSEQPPPPSSVLRGNTYETRQDYVFVGGMKHEPNVDAIRQLKRLWPHIRQMFIDHDEWYNNNNNNENNNSDTGDAQHRRVPNLYIYGAQCSDQFRTEIHNPSIGIYMEGYYPGSISNVLQNKRVLLSPLRFGAGIKGKHIESWNCYLPIVTTSIGSEGMMYPNEFNCPSFLMSHNHPSTSDYEQPMFGGLIANNDTDFIDAAFTLYTKKNVWDTAVQSIRMEFLNELCHDWDRIHQCIVNVIHTKIHVHSQQRRLTSKTSWNTASDVIQEILQHQTNRSTEYFSRYIELKEERNKDKTRHEVTNIPILDKGNTDLAKEM